MSARMLTSDDNSDDDSDDNGGSDDNDATTGDNAPSVANDAGSASAPVDHVAIGEDEIGAAVRSALIANIIVTLAKFACGLAGVQSMMSEAVHSLADSTNEIVLIAGKKASHHPPTRQHPLGGSRMRYFSGFMVALLLFGVGGLFTIISAANKVGAIVEGGPGSHDIDPRALWAAIIVAVVSACAEGWSLHKSIGEAHHRYAIVNGIISPGTDADPAEYGRIGDAEDGFSVPRFWVDTKSSDLTSVIAEDVLALIGLSIAVAGCTMSLATSDEIWDAFASLLIGFVLVIGAVMLGRQNGSLLLGEGVSARTYSRVMAIVTSDDNVDRVLEPLIGLHLSERRIDMKLKLQFKKGVDPVDAINDLEDAIRNEFNGVYSLDIWIEPDRWDPVLASKPVEYVD